LKETQELPNDESIQLEALPIFDVWKFDFMSALDGVRFQPMNATCSLSGLSGVSGLCTFLADRFNRPATPYGPVIPGFKALSAFKLLRKESGLRRHRNALFSNTVLGVTLTCRARRLQRRTCLRVDRTSHPGGWLSHRLGMV
jgi:hypothetical protein